MTKYQDEEEKNEKRIKRRIIIMIIIIILLLFLVTSCTFDFFGKMGNVFSNEEVIPIDIDTDDKEVILNKDLTFDMDGLDISLSDNESKITFDTKNINPKKFTCSTSDASIATCYVKDGYIVINPKRKGKVEVYVQAEVNGKIYKATSTVTVGEPKKYIKLDSTSGTINLSQSKTKLVAYNLIGMNNAKVTVKSSNKRVATAKIENGILKITGLKKGNATLTLTTVYNGITYTATYKVTVVNGVKGGSINNPNGGSNNQSGNNNSNKKNSDSTLKSLEISKGTLKFNKNTKVYNVGVSNSTKTVTLKGVPTSSKSKLSYTFNGKTVSNLNDLKLNPGDNTVIIKVTAEDGSTSTYKVIINREKNTKLIDIKVNHGTLSPKFKENTLDYVVKNVTSDKITITPIVSDKDATMEYYVNNKRVNNLNDINISTPGIYTVKIVVKNGNSSRTYTIEINKDASTNANLKDVKIDGTSLADFDKNNTGPYDIEVPYNTKNLNINGIPEDSKSKVTYILNGKEVSKDKIVLTNKDDNLVIRVTSESGRVQDYTFNIHKPDRTIEWGTTKNTYEIDVLGGPYKIAYEIFEDGAKIDDNKDNYSLDDIKVKYDGEAKIEVHYGYILVTPKPNTAGKKETLSLDYNGSTTSSVNLIYTIDDFYVKTSNEDNIYNMDIINGSGQVDIGLLTNIFNGSNIKTKQLSDNEVKIYSADNEDIYIIASTDNKNIKLTSTGGVETVSPVIKVEADNIKDDKLEVTIKLKASVLGNDIKAPTVTVKLRSIYIVNIYANGGQFSHLDNEDPYSFKLNSSDTLSLSNLEPFKISEDNNCYEYKLVGYDTNKDISPDETLKYGTSEVIKDLSHNLDIYAIYSKVATLRPAEEEKLLYLEGANIFGDKENELYKNEKIIYPGANGNYSMIFENTTPDDIVITGLKLRENTICVSNGCLNMGYAVKYEESSGHFYYFGESKNSKADYWILRDKGVKEDPNITTKDIDFTSDFDTDKSITIPAGGKANIAILWKWVDNDPVDTKIGEQASVDEKYKLSIGVKFKTILKECKGD